MSNFEKAPGLVAEIKAMQVALGTTFDSITYKVEELESLQGNIHSFAVEDLADAMQNVTACLATICGENDKEV